MGLFSNKNIVRNITTKNFYFGAPEAEGENIEGCSLTDYFEDYLDILGDLQKGKFIFVGRKGVGKSAIAKFIKDKSDISEDSFATILRVSDLGLEKCIQDGTSDKSDLLLFEWLILINTVKLIVNNDCGKYTKEYDKLKKFLERNTGSVEIDKFQVDEKFIKSGGEINFSVLSHAFGGILNKYFDAKTSKAPFYKLISPLRDILKIIIEYPINKELEFWLLFDDLDVNYDINNEIDNQKIIELLRVAKYYNNDIFKNCNAKILLFIRDDVRDFIISKYTDSAKIFNSYEITINWYNHGLSLTDENSNPLKRMANRRIEKNFHVHNINFQGDAWNALIKNENYGSYRAPKTSFKYILDFTFYRPRDIITFLKMISTESYMYPITPETLKKILEKYIKTNITEIKSELSLFFNDVEKDKIFKELFPFIANNSRLSYNDVLNKINDIGFSSDSHTVMKILVGYSLLIYQNQQGELFFSYREDNIESYAIEDFTISLPKCIYHYYKPIN